MAATSLLAHFNSSAASDDMHCRGVDQQRCMVVCIEFELDGKFCDEWLMFNEIWSATRTPAYSNGRCRTSGGLSLELEARSVH